MVHNLLSLPQELQIQILAHLDAISLIQSAITCKRIYAVFQSSSQLDYILQLHFDGLTDAGTSQSYSDLIINLIHRRQAWFALEWKGCSIFDMQASCLAYELIGGFFASIDGTSLEIVSLPTSESDKGRHSQIEGVEGVSARDFGMDPTQDLIALLEDDMNPPLTNIRTIRIHLRALSTSMYHPRAHQRTLQCSVLPQNGYPSNICNIALQVVRDTLVLYFCTAVEQFQPRVLVWNWISSALILDSLLPYSPSSMSLQVDFGLLSTTFCLMTHLLDSGSIWLYQLPPFSTSAILLAKLHLPLTSLGTHVVQISTHTGPIEDSALPHKTYKVNDDDRLHAFTIRYSHATLLESDVSPIHGMSTSVNLFVHQRVFMKYCKELADNARSGAPAVDVPWEEWGPYNSRMLHPACIQQHWLRYVHNQRVVLPVHDTFHPRGPFRSVEVVDFSLAAILTAKGTNLVPSSLGLDRLPVPGTLYPPNTISADDCPCFEDDVTTYLPYVSTIRNFQRQYSIFMIHEDGIIGVNIKDDESLLLDMYTI